MKSVTGIRMIRNHTIVLVLGVFVFMFAAFVEEDEPVKRTTDLERMKLKGAVRSLMITSYYINVDSESGERDTLIKQEQTFFDRTGQIYEVVHYENGIAGSISKFLFDSAGRQLLQREYDLGGNLIANITYKFDDRGYRAWAHYEWPDFDPDDDDFGFEATTRQPYNSIVYKNDYRGFCTEEQYLRPDKSQFCRYEHDYDFRGNKSEMNYYNANDRHSWRKTYKYDKDNLVELSRMYKDNRIVLRSDYSYEFDTAGNWTKKTEYRKIYYNIYSSLLKKGDIVTNRKIDYYP
jgi:hypothetical protein